MTDFKPGDTHMITALEDEAFVIYNEQLEPLYRQQAEINEKIAALEAQTAALYNAAKVFRNKE